MPSGSPSTCRLRRLGVPPTWLIRKANPMSDPRSRIGSMLLKSWPLLAISLLLAVAFSAQAQAQAKGEAKHEDLFKNKQFPSAIECQP